MKELIGRMQKDLLKLQRTLKKEIDDLGAKLKNAAKSENVTAKTREIEKLVEAKLKQFEPAVERFYTEVKTNAGKYGIDLGPIENQVKKRLSKVKRPANASARAKTQIKTRPAKQRTTVRKTASARSTRKTAR